MKFQNWHSKQTVSIGDNLHEMSKCGFLGKKSICRLLKILPRVLSVTNSFLVSLNIACLVFVLIFPENSMSGIFLIFPETEGLVFYPNVRKQCT